LNPNHLLLHLPGTKTKMTTLNLLGVFLACTITPVAKPREYFGEILKRDFECEWCGENQKSVNLKLNNIRTCQRSF